VTAPLIGIRWAPREVPLRPLAAAARGPAATRVVQRLLMRDDKELAELSGVAAADLVVVLGAQAALPWADGIMYLGRDPDAAELLLPTAQRPNVPAPLLSKALLSGEVCPPVAVLVDPPALVCVAQALPLSRRALEAWLDGKASA